MLIFQGVSRGKKDTRSTYNPIVQGLYESSCVEDPGINKMPALKLTNIEQRCTKIFSNTLQGTNISHLGKRKIIFKMPFLGDMLVPWRVCLLQKHIWGNYERTHTPIIQSANKIVYFLWHILSGKVKQQRQHHQSYHDCTRRVWAVGFVDRHWLFWRVVVENMSVWMILQGDEFATYDTQYHLIWYDLNSYMLQTWKYVIINHVVSHNISNIVWYRKECYNTYIVRLLTPHVQMVCSEYSSCILLLLVVTTG